MSIETNLVLLIFFATQRTDDVLVCLLIFRVLTCKGDSFAETGTRDFGNSNALTVVHFAIEGGSTDSNTIIFNLTAKKEGCHNYCSKSYNDVLIILLIFFYHVGSS